MQRILNVIGWIGTALVVAAVGIRLFAPFEWSQYAVYLALAGLVCVLLYPIVQWREVAGQFNRRQARYASLAATSVLVVLGILIAVNYLSNRRNTRWDLTANQIHTLSEQSQKILSGLDAPLKMILIDQSLRFDQYRERLGQYVNASRQVSLEFVDGETDPLAAKKYEVQAFPTLVMLYKDKTEKVLSLEEREITSAVIRVMSGEQRKAYFVQGHGERNPEGEEGGFRTVAALLKGDNITIGNLTLSQTKEVPDDASVVVIAGPRVDFLEEEIAQVSRYLERGGKLLLMLEPELGERPQPLTRLTAFAEQWGVDVGNDVVIDLSGQSPRPEMIMAVPPYPRQPITEGFNIQTLFPIARSVSPASPAPSGRTVQSFVQSGPGAWAESDVAGLQAGTGEPTMNAGTADKAGPVSIAVAVSTPAPPDEPKEGAKPAPQTRLAIIGDSDFASDAVAGAGTGNVDLFLNTVNWLLAQENLISIRPKERGNSGLTMTPIQMSTVRWVSLAGVPLAVLVIGLVVWNRRRSA